MRPGRSPGGEADPGVPAEHGGGEGTGQRRLGAREYRIAPPFGRGLVLALLAPRPLASLEEGRGESLGAFITSLGVALGALPDPGEVRFARVGLVTLPRS